MSDVFLFFSSIYPLLLYDIEITEEDEETCTEEDNKEEKEEEGNTSCDGNDGGDKPSDNHDTTDTEYSKCITQFLSHESSMCCMAIFSIRLSTLLV